MFTLQSGWRSLITLRVLFMTLKYYRSLVIVPIILATLWIFYVDVYLIWVSIIIMTNIVKRRLH